MFMDRGRFGLTTALAISLAACSSEPSSGPFQAMVIAPDDAGNPVLRRVALPVRDVRTLESDSFATSAKGTVRVNGGKTPSGSVTDDGSLALSVEYVDDAYVAGDFDALIAMSAAYHLSVARRHFDGLGLSEVAPGFTRKRLVFFPDGVVVNGQDQGNSDNAFFTSYIDGFVVLRPNVFEDLPLPANQGVLVHEFSHAVFHQFGPPDSILGAYFPDFNEGLADVHAAAVTGDPSFVGRSVPLVATERDLSVRHVYDAEEWPLHAADPYWYGSIVSSTFWSYRTRLIERGAVVSDANRHMAVIAFDGIRTVGWTEEELKAVSAKADIEVNLWKAFVARAEQFGERTEFCAALVEHLSALPEAYKGVCQ